MTEFHPDVRPLTRADRLVRAGVILFLVGLVALGVDVVPFFFGAENRPTWLNIVAAAGLTVGLGIALAGIVSAVRSPMPPDPDDDPTA